jgi:hypothetical protein
MEAPCKKLSLVPAFRFNIARIKSLLFNIGLFFIISLFFTANDSYARAGFAEWEYLTPIPGIKICCNDASMPQDEKCIVLYEDDRTIIGRIRSFFFTSNSIYGVTAKN